MSAIRFLIDTLLFGLASLSITFGILWGNNLGILLYLFGMMIFLFKWKWAND